MRSLRFSCRAETVGSQAQISARYQSQKSCIPSRCAETGKSRIFRADCSRVFL